MLEKTPAKIMEQLQDEIEKQGRADLRQHLSDAKALLPLFSKEQYLRPVRNVVAGMVATIIGIVCAGSDKTPIIMVSKPSQIKSDVAKLQSILDIIASLGYLIHPKIVVMKPARKYLCLKRLRNAESNGHQFSHHLKSQLTLESYSQQMQDLLGVQSCSKSCRYYDKCRYQDFKNQMASGKIQLQAYTEQMFANALRGNALPKKRRVVCPTDVNPEAKDKSCVLKRYDLDKLLTQCELLCSPAKRQKRAVYQETAAIRELEKELFYNPEVTVSQASRILTNIHDRFVKIKKLCDEALSQKGTEREQWKNRLNRVIQNTNELSTSMINITYQSVSKV